VEEGAQSPCRFLSLCRKEQRGRPCVKLFPVRTLTNFNYRAEIACRESCEFTYKSRKSSVARVQTSPDYRPLSLLRK
jgi:hypothetical protein